MANLTNYEDERVAQALSLLKLNRGNAKRTAQQLGIPRTTLRQWAGRAKSETARPKQVEPAVQHESDEKYAKRMDFVLDLSLDEGTLKDKLQKATYRDLLITSDIAIRGRALLRGQATSRTEQVRVSLMQPEELRQSALSVIEGGRKAV